MKIKFEVEMHYINHISIDHNKMLGKPCIKGTRVTVEQILRKLSEGMDIEELIRSLPSLTPADIRAAMAYSADMIKMEESLAS